MLEVAEIDGSLKPAFQEYEDRLPLQPGTLDCKSLGEVTSRSAWGGMMTEVGYESDSRALRNDTAARGGNTVLIHTKREGFGTHTRGEAFRCQ
jgi:hypothetical protein